MEAREINGQEQPKETTIVKKGLIYYIVSIIQLLFKLLYAMCKYAVLHIRDYFVEVITWKKWKAKKRRMEYVMYNQNDGHEVI